MLEAWCRYSRCQETADMAVDVENGTPTRKDGVGRGWEKGRTVERFQDEEGNSESIQSLRRDSSVDQGGQERRVRSPVPPSAEFQVSWRRTCCSTSKAEPSCSNPSCRRHAERTQVGRERGRGVSGAQSSLGTAVLTTKLRRHMSTNLDILGPLSGRQETQRVGRTIHKPLGETTSLTRTRGGQPKQKKLVELKAVHFPAGHIGVCRYCVLYLATDTSSHSCPPW